MIAFIAALPRELAPLVRGWKRIPAQSSEGHGFSRAETPSRNGALAPEVIIYKTDHALAAFAGIGPDRATRAAAAAVELGAATLVSTGYAGGVSPAAQAATIYVLNLIVDTATGERFTTGIGQGTLVTVRDAATCAAKRMLLEKYGADLVDMEAAAVARHAARHNLPFYAVKAISDSAHADLPDFGPFIRHGQFRTAAFVAHVAVRPWYWPAMLRLQRHSAHATQALARELAEWLAAGGPPARLRQTSSSPR